MPIRIASLTKKISANGLALHRAMTTRTETAGVDKEPSETEAALIEERRQLKKDQEKRKAQALLPKPSALDGLVRTRHAQAKEKKVKKETQDAGATKKPKAQKTRAEKNAAKAAALEAGRRAPKKPAK